MVVVVVQVERKAFSESAAKAEADLLKAREEIKTLQKEVIANNFFRFHCGGPRGEGWRRGCA